MYEEEKKILEQVKGIPYPEYRIMYPNFKYANMLYDDYAGKWGELSAITQYIYEHINVKGELSHILLEIAITEMRHLDIVGDMIQKLGGKPMYISSNNIAWSSTNVEYDMKNLKEVMLYNKKAEEEAIEGYRKAIQYTSNQTLKKMFERIIQDEQSHKRIFEILYQKM